MAFEDRQQIVATVQETYAVMGRAIGTNVPEAVLRDPVRPDIMRQLSDLQIDWRVADEQMRNLLINAYEELAQNVLQLRYELLRPEDVGPRYDYDLGQVGLTRNGWRVKWHGFSTGIDNLLRHRSRPAAKRVFRWANVILGSLSGVPGAGVVVEPLRELKESIEASGEDAEAPPVQNPPAPGSDTSEAEKEYRAAAELEEQIARTKAAADEAQRRAHEMVVEKQNRLKAHAPKFKIDPGPSRD
jgi:hypothetical protein